MYNVMKFIGVQFSNQLTCGIIVTSVGHQMDMSRNQILQGFRMICEKYDALGNKQYSRKEDDGLQKLRNEIFSFPFIRFICRIFLSLRTKCCVN